MSRDEEVAQRAGSLRALSGLRKRDNIHLLVGGIRDAVMETCGGSQNFRLQDRPWLYTF
jgi:hypothetical protein